jgi:hypothetical protein
MTPGDAMRLARLNSGLPDVPLASAAVMLNQNV